jgi:deoxyribonuclease-1
MARVYRLLSWIIFFLGIAIVLHAGEKGNTTNNSFSKSKRILLEQVFHDHHITFYCDNPFTAGKDVIPTPDKYTPKNPNNKRSKRIEWEHIVPASLFGQQFKSWSEGHSACVKNDGTTYKGRKCAEKTSSAYQYMRDMYNLVPAIGEVNGLRSNYPYRMIPGEEREFGVCDMEFASKTAEPPPVQRGNIARTYYYMDYVYPGYGIINDNNRALFQQWAVGDPVDSWECDRVKRVEEVQGNGNGFVKFQCIVRGMW